MPSATTVMTVSGKACRLQDIEATLAELLREHSGTQHEGQETTGVPTFSHSITPLPGEQFLVTLIAVHQLA